MPLRHERCQVEMCWDPSSMGSGGAFGSLAAFLGIAGHRGCQQGVGLVWGPQAERTAPPVPAPTPLLGQLVPTAGACVISSLCFVKFASSEHHVAGPAAPSRTPRPHCNGTLVLMSPSPLTLLSFCLAFPAPDRQQSPRQGMVLPWGSHGDPHPFPRGKGETEAHRLGAGLPAP